MSHHSFDILAKDEMAGTEKKPVIAMGWEQGEGIDCENIFCFDCGGGSVIVYVCQNSLTLHLKGMNFTVSYSSI